MKGKARHATNAQTLLRVEELVRLRLDGVEHWGVREYVRKQVGLGGGVWGPTPLSDSQLYRLMQKADSQIAKSCSEKRPQLLKLHLAKRRRLYARAIHQGDLRTALAVIQDEATLHGLYDDEANRRLDALEDRLNQLGSKP